MKQFNLKDYEAGCEVVTRSGHPVRIMCTDRKSINGLPVVALVNKDGVEILASTDILGRYNQHDFSVHAFDLFMKVEKVTRWTNVYKLGQNFIVGQLALYTTESQAKATEDLDNPNYVGTFPIEIEV